MSDAICDPQDAVPAYRWSGFWTGTVCIVSLVPVVLPLPALASGGLIYSAVSMVTLLTLLLMLPTLWPAAFALRSAGKRPVWTRRDILCSTFANAVGFFGVIVFLDGCLSPGSLHGSNIMWTLLAAVLVGLSGYRTNRRMVGRPMRARYRDLARRVPAWPARTERSIVLAAPYALAVAATVLSAAGGLPRESSPYLGWSVVAVVGLGWTLPSLAMWFAAQIVIIPLVPVAVQADRCGFGLRHRSPERDLLRHAVPWTGCLGLATAEIMAGRPFWLLHPAMWLWAAPGVLAGSSGAYAWAASFGQADRG